MSEFDVIVITNMLSRNYEPGDIIWAGKDIIRKTWKPLEKRAFARFEAEHIVKHMVDEIMIHGNHSLSGIRDIDLQHKNIRNKDIRQSIIDQIVQSEEEEVVEVVEPKEEPEEKEVEKITPSKQEENLADLSMKELRARVKAAGGKVPFGASKQDLINLLWKK